MRLEINIRRTRADRDRKFDFKYYPEFNGEYLHNEYRRFVFNEKLVKLKRHRERLHRMIEEQEILNAEPDAQEQLADLRERFPWTKPSEHPMPDKLEDIVSTSGMDWDPQQLSLEEGGPDIKLMDSK